MSKQQNEIEGYEIPIELTPEWWKDHILPVEDAYIIIPDTMYPQKTGRVIYESDDNSEGMDYKTGVIVKSPFNVQVGYWCHYKPHGPHEFHPFRPRHENGKSGTVQGKSALFVRKDDIVIITNKKIF